MDFDEHDLADRADEPILVQITLTREGGEGHVSEDVLESCPDCRAIIAECLQRVAQHVLKCVLEGKSIEDTHLPDPGMN